MDVVTTSKQRHKQRHSNVLCRLGKLFFFISLFLTKIPAIGFLKQFDGIQWDVFYLFVIKKTLIICNYGYYDYIINHIVYDINIFV